MAVLHADIVLLHGEHHLAMEVLNDAQEKWGV